MITTRHHNNKCRMRKMPVSAAIAVLHRLSAAPARFDDLIAVTGVSRATLYRVLSDLGKFEVQIHCDAQRNYRVFDWGMINPERL